MTGDQTRPLEGSTAFGTSWCELERMASPPSLTCQVAHTVPTGVDVLAFDNLPQQENLTAFLYYGAAGQQGVPLYQFQPGNALRGVFSDTWILASTNASLQQGAAPTLYGVAQQVADLLDGLWYVQLNSRQYPAGNIRGQLGHQDRVYARLSYANVVPPAQVRCKYLCVSHFRHRYSLFHTPRAL